MSRKNSRLGVAFGSVGLLVCVAGMQHGEPAWAQQPSPAMANTANAQSEMATAVVAGGCFWCVETDFEKAPGVVDVVSGYSGGRSQNPTYKNYSSGGHREVAMVTYDPSKITYAGVVEWLVKHIDPTDSRGSFNDRGVQYSPAVYFGDEDEKAEAQRVFAAIDKLKVYRGKVQVALRPRVQFWPAEEYHQDYHHKNTIKYSWFRLQSGRDKFVSQHWGNRAANLELPGSVPGSSGTDKQSEVLALYEKWRAFKKPSAVELKKKLSPTQFKVSQRDGTETAFNNAYNNNKKAGIYVDLVSGAPVFSSSHKFDSGTGWPSFTQPIIPQAVSYKVDRSNLLLGARREVRSSIGDSHLGHVFADGPKQAGGQRYCMNSAAMKFIAKEEMESKGYGDFLKFVR